MIDLTKIALPKVCPVCGGKLEIQTSKDGVKNLFCVNEKCPSRFNEQVSAFCERLGIMGVSNTTLENWGIKTIKDIVEFKPNPAYKNEVKFAEELDKKMWNAQKVDIFVALSALVYGVGRREMKKFWDSHCGELYFGGGIHVDCPTVKETTIINAIPVVKEAYESIVLNKKYHEPKEVYQVPEIVPEKGTICFTGKLETMTRTQAQTKARELGYEIADSVAKGLGTLVVADAGLKGEPSSKLKKAQKLGIKIMSESEFNAL
jgi:DNA ligase (NAD+)